VSNRVSKHQLASHATRKHAVRAVTPRENAQHDDSPESIQPSITEGRNYLAAKPGGNSTTFPVGGYECTWDPREHLLASRCSGGVVSLSRCSRDGVADRPAAGAIFDTESNGLAFASNVHSHSIVDDSGFRVRALGACRCCSSHAYVTGKCIIVSLMWSSM